MLLALLVLLTDLPNAADRNPVICVNHQIRPTVFTPLLECMSARRWVRVLRSRERNNLPVSRASQVIELLPRAALYASFTSADDPLARVRRNTLQWDFPSTDAHRYPVGAEPRLPSVEGSPFRR